ncbi:aspartyl-phosphate phosphatase Spo0E family protein [Pelosinus sp. IPA-1]|uniref:aspartyl-phosphate phosphatase Spo0E family protein n=1 Tax=Pelosinus sp. IPA-1 TaxID=3029569 RepID=UPI0024362994|nr:aspartyl-phosphate phosphatase Spo0E family protein [Pelosinus sp. IPA-1]GMA99483.1 hypothetical protein PIPA1_22830 [Pelosinus sp. IPA-1]
MTYVTRKEPWEETERLRDEFHNIAIRKGISSPDAIRASQLLDIKLNEYYCSQRQVTPLSNKA